LGLTESYIFTLALTEIKEKLQTSAKKLFY
jgi:hypothetical protein